jgi:hypothetical protein
VAAVASTDLEKHSGHEVVKGAVSPQDEPSAEWGWHGSFPRGRQIAGWFAAAVCFLMLIGNQIGHVEDIYLVITGTVLVLLLIWDLAKRRNPWRKG